MLYQKLIIAQICLLLILSELFESVEWGFWELYLINFFYHLFLKFRITVIIVINVVSEYFWNLFLLASLSYANFRYLRIFQCWCSENGLVNTSLLIDHWRTGIVIQSNNMVRGLLIAPSIVLLTLKIFV